MVEEAKGEKERKRADVAHHVDRLIRSRSVSFERDAIGDPSSKMPANE